MNDADCSVALLDAPTPGLLRRAALRVANAARRVVPQSGPGWYPGAVHRPVPEATTQSPIVPWSAIVHTNGATGHTPSLYSWILNPASNGMECHIQAALNGTLEQYMPVNRRADCNYKANAFVVAGQVCGAVSIETEDFGAATLNETPLTPAQFEAIAGFLAWLHREWGVPVVIPPEWDARGVGYHTQFPYPLWTNVPGKTCPATAKKAQLPALRARALELAGVTPPIPAPAPPAPVPVPPLAYLEVPVSMFNIQRPRGWLNSAAVDGGKVINLSHQPAKAQLLIDSGQVMHMGKWVPPGTDYKAVTGVIESMTLWNDLTGGVIPLDTPAAGESAGA